MVPRMFGAKPSVYPHPNVIQPLQKNLTIPPKNADTFSLRFGVAKAKESDPVTALNLTVEKLTNPESSDLFEAVRLIREIRRDEWGIPYSEERVADHVQYIQHAMSKGQVPLFILLKDQADKIVALGMLKEEKGREGQIRASVESVYIEKNYRNHGLGQFLMQTLEASARNRGHRAFYLQVRYDNAPAIKLYTKLGFTKLSLDWDRDFDGKPLIPTPRKDGRGWRTDSNGKPIPPAPGNEIPEGEKEEIPILTMRKPLGEY